MQTTILSTSWTKCPVSVRTGRLLFGLGSTWSFLFGIPEMIKSKAQLLRPLLSKAMKNKILEKYDNECQYCYDAAEVVDHVIPLSYSLDNSEENLVASCWLCNAIAGDRVFRSFGQKRKYIIDRRYNYIKKHPIPLWTREEVEEMGRKLKQDFLRGGVVVCENDEERNNVCRRLMKEGWRVVIGGKAVERRMKIVKKRDDSLVYKNRLKSLKILTEEIVSKLDLLAVEVKRRVYFEDKDAGERACKISLELNRLLRSWRNQSQSLEVLEEQWRALSTGREAVE